MTNYNERLDDVLSAVYLAGTENGLSRRITDPEEIMHRKEAFIKGNRVSDEAKQAIVEWHEIEKSEVYNSGCADTVRHILALFDNQIPEQLKRWLRLEIEDRGKL